MSTTEKDGIAGPKQDEDLRRNPGIGQSKGTTAAGEKVEEIEGDNTVEGDIENDPDAAGGEIGRAHVLTPVTNAHLVCRLLLEKKNQTQRHPRTTTHTPHKQRQPHTTHNTQTT